MSHIGVKLLSQSVLNSHPMNLMNRISFAAFLLAIVGLASFHTSAQPRKAPPTPNWIWAQGKVHADQSLYFRKTFDLDLNEEQLKGVTVTFWGSADNVLHATVNDVMIGFSTEWQMPMQHDITRHVRPGKNTIAVRATNQGGSAAMIARITIKTAPTKQTVIVSDESWKYADASDFPKDDPRHKQFASADFDDSKWTGAKVIGKLGIAPWGNLGGSDGKPIQATPAENLALLPGFNAELLYTVPKATQGSWVAICVDPKGRLICSDQGGYLYRVAVGKTADDTRVEKIDQPIGMAQGLLFAYDALYIVVNGGGIKGPDGKANGPGLYRLSDTNNDDRFDKLEKLATFPGGGSEHGPHAIRKGPDGKLYVIAGNFTKTPQPQSPNSPFRESAEDQLLVRNPDGGGHDPHIFAPGGWLARTDKDAKEWELVCAGMRNAYDFDFNADGEIFTFDSDMEWDTGTPWYRPIRVNHLVSGGEYGWRNGTGKWPAYYPDSLGAVVNVGMGSPVGVAFGYGARFPAKYQHAFFIQDWAYGKVYAVHMTPQGASYSGVSETFVSGKGFPVTDLVIHPDGAMYITIGGRGTQSGLYRITYTGNEPTSPVTPPTDPASAQARALRQKLESFHTSDGGTPAINLALANLNSPDRSIRYAARVALENQPMHRWQDKALEERRPTALINAAIALIRSNSKVAKRTTYATLPDQYDVEDVDLSPRILAALGKLDLKALSEEQLLEMLRAYSLAFIRLGPPNEATAKAVTARIAPLFPYISTSINREASQLLVYLKANGIVQSCMEQLAQATTQEDQLHYVLVLRNLPASHWTLAQRQAYFSWINHALAHYKGGASFRKFLARIQDDAMKTLTDEERKQLDPILKGDTRAVALKVTAPRQFIKNWQMDDLLPSIDQATRGRSFDKGKQVFEAAQCSACHRFNADGGATGPDLTGVGNRFSPADVLEAILLPSKVISDQYQTTMIDTTDGDTQVGRITMEDDAKLLLQPNPLSTDTIEIAKREVKSRTLSKVSMMPQGLVDHFTKEEILDLIAYLRSAGDTKDKAFSK